MAPPGPERIACIECDLVVTIPDLADGQRAYCSRCGHLITARSRDPLTTSLAFALAALILLIMANAFSFLDLRSNGLEQVMTLPRSALELYRDGDTTIAILVLGPIVGIPGTILTVIVSLLVPLRLSHPAPWLVPAGRLLFMLSPWSMVEVFVIGVLVSLVKIGTLATVILGVSFWSYAAFAICFTVAVSRLDRLQIWREIEACGT
jgi:paraquat-inducible protein A